MIFPFYSFASSIILKSIRLWRIVALQNGICVYNIYMKEKYHSMKIKNNKPLLVDEQVENSRYFPEEALGFKYAYKNNGLYPHSYVNNFKLANTYWGSVYGYEHPLITNKVWNIFYTIPRKW